jgi:hypothetical protein
MEFADYFAYMHRLLDEIEKSRDPIRKATNAGALVEMIERYIAFEKSTSGIEKVLEALRSADAAKRR